MELKDNLLADIKDFQSDMLVYDIVANSSDVIINFIDGSKGCCITSTL